MRRPYATVVLLGFATAANHLLIVQSDFTPAAVHTLLTQATGEFQPLTPFTLVSFSALPTSAFDSVLAIVDASFSPLQTQAISGLCSERQIPHIVLGYVNDAPLHQWTFYISGRQTAVAEKVMAVLRFFDWNRVNIVRDGSGQMQAIEEVLRGIPTLQYQSIEFLQQDEESVERIVGRVMRLSGNRITVFLTTAELTEKIVKMQNAKNIGGEGYGNVLPLLSSLFAVNSQSVPSAVTGGLIVAEEELAIAESEQSYYSLLLNSAFSLCAVATDTIDLQRILSHKFPTHYREAPFVLLNMRAGHRTVVGKIENDTVTVWDTIHFLGDSTTVPANAKSKLEISANFGTGNVNYIEASVNLYHNGAMLAIDHVNTKLHLLDNFYLDVFNFTAGVTQWSYEYAYSHINPNKTRLGLAVLSGVSSGVTMKLIGLLSDLGYNGPVVGSSNTVNALSSRTDFPMFVRTILPDSYITRVYVQMFKRFGWTRCGLFVSNETWGLGFQRDFTVFAQNNGITILNDPLLQVLPTPLVAREYLKPYEANLQNFIDTKARILIIVVNINAIFVVDYLYDLGLRGGDLQIVANEWMSDGYVQTNDSAINQKRIELLTGAIQFSPVGFLGDFGASVQRDYSNAYGVEPSIYSCYFYDSVLALAEAVNLVMKTGGDYTDPRTLMKALRGSRFVGCTGTVTFDPDTNDRSPMPYDVLNAQFAGNRTDIVTIGRYDPTASIVFTFTSDIIWCDGTTNVPKDVRDSTNGCPFEDKLNQDFPQGRFLLYGVCAGVSVVTAALCVVIWKMWKSHTIPPLKDRKEIQVQDAIVMLGVAVELVQYISLGPDLRTWLLPAVTIMSGTILNLEDFMNLKDGGFTKVWVGVFCAAIVWIGMVVCVLLRVDERCKSVPGCQFLGEISELLAPLINTLCFLPIISILLDVFVCTEGLGLSESSVSYTDSYLHKDCYLQCWKSSHLQLVIGSSISLAVYIPAAIILRPLWQELEPALNVKSAPGFLIFKSATQTVIIVLNKTVTNKIAHCSVFVTVMAAFALFSATCQTFNYKRVAFWHIIALLAVLWSSILRLLQLITASTKSTVFLGLVCTGWGLLAVFGAIYQRLKIPSLLFRRRGIDTEFLFKFAFQRATPAIVSRLAGAFQQAGNRCSIGNPPGKYEIGREGDREVNIEL